MLGEDLGAIFNIPTIGGFFKPSFPGCTNTSFQNGFGAFYSLTWPCCLIIFFAYLGAALSDFPKAAPAPLSLDFAFCCALSERGADLIFNSRRVPVPTSPPATQIPKKVNNQFEPRVNIPLVGAVLCVSRSEHAAVAFGNAPVVLHRSQDLEHPFFSSIGIT